MVKFLNSLNLDETGSGLTEVLIATAMVGVVLTTFAIGMTSSIKTTAEARYRDLATDKAQEAIELFRREKIVAGWEDFSTLDGTYCLESPTLPEDIEGLRQRSASNPTHCNRSLDLGGTAANRYASVTRNADSIQVTVTMEWPAIGRDTQLRSLQLDQVLREF